MAVLQYSCFFIILAVDGVLLRGFQAFLVRLPNEFFSLQFRLLCLCVVVRFDLFMLASEIHHQGSDPSCRNSVWLITY